MNEPFGEASWDDYDRNKEMDYMTNWMAQQAGDKRKFIWKLNIAGRQYHFPYPWGSMGVYYDFKDGSFSCVISYNI